MNLFAMTLALSLTFATSTLPPAPTDEVVEIEFEIYKVMGDISGETSLTDNIWEGLNKSKEEMKAKYKDFTFFVLADLTVGGIQLKANETEWTWDGKEQPPKNNHCTLISKPHVLIPPNESFTIEIGEKVPAMQWYEKRPDGLFELKTTAIETGMKISSRIEKGPSNRIVLKDFQFEMSSIDLREKIEGVDLDVGKPVITKRAVSTDLAIKPDCYYGIMIHTKGRGTLIMKICARLVPIPEKQNK